MTTCHAPGPAAVDDRPRGDGDGGGSGEDAGGRPRVLLVGSPNVGKSVLFNRLTGHYVAVSNYPGTSVELVQGEGSGSGRPVTFVDTPGIYSLLPTTDEERVTRDMILSGAGHVLVHVVDAKSLGRSLPLTLQLAEVGRPVVLALNMMDEAEARGLALDPDLLSSRLGVPVVPVVAVTGRGIEELEVEIDEALDAGPPPPPRYRNGVGQAMADVSGRLGKVYPVDPAVLASLLIQGDTEVGRLIRDAEDDGGEAALEAARSAESHMGTPAAYRAAVERQRVADELARGVLTRPGARDDAVRRPSRFDFGRWLVNPWTGIPIFGVILYLGLYKFVGQLGAGFAVDWLESVVFEGWLNPAMEAFFSGIPWESVRSLYVGEYGLLTLGLRYAVAIVLPIVGAFFLLFSALEDSGYLPRLALLMDRAFKKMGLNGRAVIPLVLGFACDTMATMVTRTLETNRERVLATLLLALAIPCSAQLGVILAVLGGQPLAFGVWVGAVAGSFFLVGWAAARLMPGQAATFHMEIPPLRRPRLGNVLTKTVTRMHWYFLEVLPLFLLASVLLWAGKLTGIFETVVAGMEPVVGALGLPAETATIFLFGFFRRDYGAAGLFDITQTGSLDWIQITVAAVTLTLFVPCVAQFLIMLKERGTRMALAVFAFATVFAFTVGWALNLTLRILAGGA